MFFDSIHLRQSSKFALLTFLAAIVSNSAVANSNLLPCPTDTQLKWNNCYGSIVFNDTTKYVGEFQNDSFDGKGVGILPNGNRYSGEYKRGKRDGLGIEYDAKGAILRSGRWSNGNLEVTLQLLRAAYPFYTREEQIDIDKNSERNEFKSKNETNLTDKSLSVDSETKIFRLNSKYWWTDIPKGFNRSTYNKILGCRDIKNIFLRDDPTSIQNFSQTSDKVAINVPFVPPGFDPKGLPADLVKIITSKMEIKVQSLKIDSLSLTQTLVFPDGSTSTYKYEYEKSGLIRYLVAASSTKPVDTSAALISNIDSAKSKGLPGILKVVCVAQGSDENSPF